MHSIIARLLIGTFAVGLLGVSSGCIIRAEGEGHGHVRHHNRGRSYYHCHEGRGRHHRRVCHDVRHGY